jgi:hypothetical protein
MAVPFNLDTGQEITYLLLLSTPILVYHLSSMLMPTSPQEACTLVRVFLQCSSIPSCSPFQRIVPCKHWKKFKCKPRVRMRMSDDAHGPWPTYLWPLLWKPFQVGCCFKCSLRKWVKWIHQMCHATRHMATRLAFQAEDSGSQVCFDTDSIPTGVDNHASWCMAHNKRLFEDLCLNQVEQQVRGFNNGLAIAGQGMMVITIDNDSRRTQKIKIPNSLFLSDLRVCLLLPQHWAQEAGDNYPLPNGTTMENKSTNCTLIWGQGQFCKMIPFDSSMNTPIFAPYGSYVRSSPPPWGPKRQEKKFHYCLPSGNTLPPVPTRTWGIATVHSCA